MGTTQSSRPMRVSRPCGTGASMAPSTGTSRLETSAPRKSRPTEKSIAICTSKRRKKPGISLVSQATFKARMRTAKARPPV